MEQKPIKPYKQLKQKQKAKISDDMYLETQAFWQAIKIKDLQSVSPQRLYLPQYRNKSRHSQWNAGIIYLLVRNQQRGFLF